MFLLYSTVCKITAFYKSWLRSALLVISAVKMPSCHCNLFHNRNKYTKFSHDENTDSSVEEDGKAIKKKGQLKRHFQKIAYRYNIL